MVTGLINEALKLLATEIFEKFTKEIEKKFSLSLNQYLYQREIFELNMMVIALSYYEAEKGESEYTISIRSNAERALFNYTNASQPGILDIGEDGVFNMIKRAEDSFRKAVNDSEGLPKFQEYMTKAYKDVYDEVYLEFEKEEAERLAKERQIQEENAEKQMEEEKNEKERKEREEIQKKEQLEKEELAEREKKRVQEENLKKKQIEEEEKREFARRQIEEQIEETRRHIEEKARSYKAMDELIAQRQAYEQQKQAEAKRTQLSENFGCILAAPFALIGFVVHPIAGVIVGLIVYGFSSEIAKKIGVGGTIALMVILGIIIFNVLHNGR